MITHVHNGIFKPKHVADFASLGTTRLFNALLKTNTPKGLNHHPKDTNVVGSKWIFRKKFNFDGTIDCYKACLVTQGFT